eukprot:GFUD01020829.1.p1 GENE.GFUD01020829.1~~GFUD01020829.1.p1  ORF type:complete len:243 (+),score=48.72 GFUD01020829.1:109-837(+)
MRAFIVCLAIAAVSGDAKPYTVAQVAAGLPVANALADGRPHNVGVITNAVEAGVKTVGALPLTLAASVYSGYPYGVVPHVAGAYSAYPYGLHAYGKREAEPYTLAQVAHGQIAAGGVVTGISFGHGTGLQPATSVAHTYGVVPHVAAAYSAFPYGIHHVYGKREAEPYTLEQVAHGKTAGGVITGIDYGHGTGLQPATAVTYNTAAHLPPVYSAHVPALHAAVPAVYSAAYSAVPAYYNYYG